MAVGPVSSAVNKTRIDVQGFIYWDPDHANDASHSCSGWEIHPLTAWRISCPQLGYPCSPNFSLGATPHSVTISPGKSATANITINSSNLFSGRVNFTATISPSGPSAPALVFNPSNYNVTACNLCGVLASKLNITTMTASSGTYNITVTARSTTVISKASVLAVMVGFNMTSSPSSLNIAASKSNQSVITLTSTGYSWTVSLSASVTGCGCFLKSVSPSPVTLSVGGKASATLNVTAFSPGNALVTITGTSSTSPPFTITTTVSVNVVDFTISAGQTNLKMYPGSPNSTVITLTSLNSFSGSVTIKATSTPAGLTQALNASSVILQPGGTVHVSLVVNGTQPGIYTVTVNATSGSVSHLLFITVKVVDFSLSSISSLQVNVGSTSTATINMTSLGGFVGTVGLSNSTSSSALHDALSTQVVSLSSGGSGSAILTVYGTSSGSYTVTITATSGPLRHNIIISVNVVDFQISAGSVTPASVNVGSRGNATITVTGVNGFTGIVALSISAPPGLTCSLSSIRLSLPPSPATSVLSCSSSTANDYVVTVTGINGTLSHTTASLLFHIVDFSITSLPSSSISLVVGQTSSSTSIHLGSLNGFTGTVALNALVSPIGPSASLSPPSLKLAPSGCACNASSLNINAGQVAGVYTLNVVATTGLLIHWTIMTLTVTRDSPSITTTISSPSIVAGGSVSDSAKLTGSTSTAGGTVTYFLFTNGACTAPATIVSIVTVSNNVIPNSRPVVFNATTPYSFNATFSGDNNNSPASSPCEPLVVQKDNSTIATSLLPASIQVGQSATDSATLSSFFQAGGTVNYNLFIGSSICTGTSSTVSTVTVANGVIPDSRSVTFNSTNPGGYSFQAVYSGDPNNNGATSRCEPLTVNPVGVTVTTVLSDTTITVGGTATDTSTLHGQTATAGGTVTYNDFANSNCATPGTVVSIVTVSNSVVPNSRTVTFNSSGTFSFNAVYSGDANNNGSTSSCESLTVNKAAPTITTTINPSTTITVGSSVTDQTTLTGGFPSTGVGGTVTYRFFGLGNGVCSGTPATIQTVNVGAGNSVTPSSSQTPSSAGQYSFNATYSGDTNNNQVTSSCESLTVNLVSTTTGIICGSSVTVGVPTSCTVTVSDIAPGTLTPTGAVSLSTNSTGTFSPPSPCNLVGTTSSASCTVSYTPTVLGAHNITATYTGDNKHGSSSGFSVLSPGKHTTSISISCSSPILANQASTCTAIVTDTSTVGATSPAGSVGFSETGVAGSFNVTSCALVGTGSTASCGVKFSPSVSGTASIIGTYSGDSTHTGSSNNGSPTTVTVNPTLIVNTPSTTSSAIDSGQTATLSAAFTGGTSPYVCQWLQKTSGATSYSNLGGSFPCNAGDKPITSTGVLSTAGSWSFELKVTDAGSPPEPVTSAAVSATVNPALTAPVISVNPTVINAGQIATLSTGTSFTAGTPTYSCQWLQKAPAATTYSNLGTSFACGSSDKPTISTGALSTGSWSFELQVSDSGSPSEIVPSNPVAVTVNGVLSAGTISPNAPAIDTGQSIALTSNPSGGTAPYSYQWYSDGTCTSAISSATTPTINTSPSVTSTYFVRVTDSASSSQCSLGDTVTVNPALVASAITPSTPTIDSGQSITLGANSSGGTAPYHYQWYSGLSSTCSSVTMLLGTTATQIVSPTTSTYYCYAVTDSAFAPATQSSAADLVTVDPTLVAGPISPLGPTIDSGQSVTLTSNPSGGTSPYSYQWYAAASCTSGSLISGAISSAYTASPPSTTNYFYKVTDSSQGSPIASQCSPGDLVTVNPALVVGAITPSSPTIDSGQSITLTSHASGGTPSLSYQWYSDGTCTSVISGATLSTYSASPTSVSTYSYKATDSAYAPVSQCSSGDTVTVNPALVAQVSRQPVQR